jgi:hypothetical protein
LRTVRKEKRGTTYVLVFGEREDVPFGVRAAHRVHKIPKAVEGDSDVAGNELRRIQGGDGKTLDGL